MKSTSKVPSVWLCCDPKKVTSTPSTSSHKFIILSLILIPRRGLAAAQELCDWWPFTYKTTSSNQTSWQYLTLNNLVYAPACRFIYYPGHVSGEHITTWCVRIDGIWRWRWCQNPLFCVLRNTGIRSSRGFPTCLHALLWNSRARWLLQAVVVWNACDDVCYQQQCARTALHASTPQYCHRLCGYVQHRSGIWGCQKRTLLSLSGDVRKLYCHYYIVRFMLVYRLRDFLLCCRLFARLLMFLTRFSHVGIGTQTFRASTAGLDEEPGFCAKCMSGCFACCMICYACYNCKCCPACPKCPTCADCCCTIKTETESFEVKAQHIIGNKRARPDFLPLPLSLTHAHTYSLPHKHTHIYFIRANPCPHHCPNPW